MRTDNRSQKDQEQTNNEKKSYSEPTLEKRERLIDVTEGYGSPAPVST